MTSPNLDSLILFLDEVRDTSSHAVDPVRVEPGMPETASWSTPDSLPLLAGCHLIGASSWATEGSGGYTLSVTEQQ